MAPAVGVGSASKDFKKESGTARLLGSGMELALLICTGELTGITGSAGIAELLIFHPVCCAAEMLFDHN